MKLLAALLAAQLVATAQGFLPGGLRPRRVQKTTLAAPWSPVLARSVARLPSFNSLAPSAAVSPAPRATGSPVALVRRAAATVAARLLLARCCVASFLRQRRLRARLCTFVAACAFSATTLAPLSAHADAGAMAQHLPIQEKIARQHEAWVAKKKQEGTNQFIKIVCAGPVMLFALAQFGKVAVRYSDYQSRSVMEEDISLYGEYIATDATELEVEAVEDTAPDAAKKDKKAPKKPNPDDDKPPKPSDDSDLI